MTPLPRLLSAAVLSFALLCGPATAEEIEPVPADAVARVGDEAITKTDFDKWFDRAVRGEAGQIEFVPPDYERCVTVTRRIRAGMRKPKLSAGELRKRCRRRHATIRDQVTQFSAWTACRARRPSDGSAVSSPPTVGSARC